MKHNPTYISWRSMRRRCNQPTHHRWGNYGGRGIKICERWSSFKNFLADMGERPDGTTLDRFPNNDGNYEPGNVRWATAIDQSNNRRTNRFLTFQGKTMTIVQWAKNLGMSRQGLGTRLQNGWTTEQALSTPPINTGLRARIGGQL